MLYGARAQWLYIPSGIDGVRATLKQMVKIARTFLKPAAGNKEAIDSLLFVRICAQRCVQHVREKDYRGEVAALHRFVRDEIRYVRDHLTAETLQLPDKTIQIGSGDCDDKSILLCTLAHCIGYPSRFCAIAVNDEPDFSHVSAQILVDGAGWLNAETIPIDDSGRKVDLGWFPSDCTNLMTAHI